MTPFDVGFIPVFMGARRIPAGEYQSLALQNSTLMVRITRPSFFGKCLLLVPSQGWSAIFNCTKTHIWEILYYGWRVHYIGRRRTSTKSPIETIYLICNYTFCSFCMGLYSCTKRTWIVMQWYWHTPPVQIATNGTLPEFLFVEKSILTAAANSLPIPLWMGTYLLNQTYHTTLICTQTNCSGMWAAKWVTMLLAQS